MRRWLVPPIIGISFGFLAGCSMGAANSGNGGSGGGGNSGNPTTVTFKVTSVTPTAVATQIGTGSFSAASVASGTLTLSIPSGTNNFAVAYACPAATATVGNLQISAVMENVVEATTADGTSFDLYCSPTTASANTGILTGSVDASAISGANYVGVAAGGGNMGNQYFLSGASASFSKSMPAGSDRVAVGAYVETAGNQLGANTSLTLAAVRNFDGIPVPGSLNGGNTVVLGAADAVTVQPITYKNVPSGYMAPTTYASYSWSSGGGFQLTNNAGNQYPAVPAGAAQSGDVYFFSSMCQSSTGLPLQTSNVETWMGTGGPLTVTFPAAWAYTGPTPAAAPVFSMAYAGFAGSGNVYYGGNLSWQAGQNASYTRSVVATAGYLNGSTTLAMPDLSAVQGFVAPPASGTSVFWTALIGQTSYPVLQSNPTSGTASIVSSSGTFTVP
ncbi:MAG: hypothetical protein ACLGSD_12965 [Acidobacteriota bacterium]